MSRGIPFDVYSPKGCAWCEIDAEGRPRRRDGHDDESPRVAASTQCTDVEVREVRAREEKADATDTRDAEDVGCWAAVTMATPHHEFAKAQFANSRRYTHATMTGLQARSQSTHSFSRLLLIRLADERRALFHLTHPLSFLGQRVNYEP